MSGVEVGGKTLALPQGSTNARMSSDLTQLSLHTASELCRCALSPLPQFTSQVLAAAKIVTGAMWAELLLVQGKKLMVCPAGRDAKFVLKQSRQHFEITSGSLAGLVAITGQTKNFSSPNISAFYKNSTNKLTPFSPTTFQPEETWSVAAVPISDGASSRSGVLMLFNKRDERSPQTFFTDTDIALCSELCEIVGALIEIRKVTDATKSELEAFQEFLLQRNSLESTFVQAYGKKKRLTHLFKALGNASELTAELLQVLAEALEVDAVLVHAARENKLELRMALGLASDKSSEKAALYCAYTTKEPVVVPDISAEPLFFHCKTHMKSAICYPIVKNQVTVAVFEFFRKATSFSELDLSLFGKTLKALQHISVKAYERFLPNQKELGLRELRSDSLVCYLKQFSLPRRDEIFDYVKLFNSVEATLKRLFRCSMCSLYCCDEARRLIWTRKSDSCDPLTFPRTSDSLLGYLSFQRTATFFPLPENLLTKRDAPAYAKAKGVSMPILGSYMGEEHVLGILLLMREDPLSSEEVRRVKLLTEVLSSFLLVLFFDRSYKKAQGNSLRRASSFLEVNIEEIVLEREHTNGKTFHVSETTAGTLTPWLRLIPDFTSIPAEQLHRVSQACAAVSSACDPLKTLAQSLPSIVPCDSARLLMYDNDRRLLIDQATGTHSVPAGLTKACLLSQSLRVYDRGASKLPDFSPMLDGAGKSSVESLAVAPILCYGNRAEGAIVFVNAETSLLSPVLLQLLACLPRDIVIAKDDTAQNWRTLAQTGRRQKMLFKWCGEIFRVLVLSQERTLMCNSILNRLRMSPELADLLAITLETLSLILSAEGARLVIRRPGVASFSQFTRESGLTAITEPLAVSLQQAFERGVSHASGASGLYQNSFCIPITLNQEIVALVEIWNKKDEMLTSFVSFEASDEAVVQEVCQQLGAPCQALITNAGGCVLQELTAVLKERAWAINNYALLNTIRRACKGLLDCDRASVFLVEGDKLVIRPQGNDSEIPVGITVPIGVGIVGSVAQSGKTVLLDDVYQDSRFNPAVDMKTGYRTRTMLCAPVLANGRVIAALQMINKSSGLFDATDTEILEMFSDLAASALQSMHMFQTVIAEKKMYTDILNTLGCAIVLLRDGVLDFSNRSIEQLLGVSEAFAVSHPFSQWMSLAPTLKADIQAVQDNTVKTARKKFQILQNKETDDRRFDYRVIPVDDEGSVKQKLMLVFEEIGNKALQSSPRLQSKSRVQSQTILQECINQLAEVMEKTDPDVKASLEFVVHTLKSGNLHHTKIFMEESALASSIDPEIMQPSPILMQYSSIKRRKSAEMFLSIQEVASSAISLEELRDWNLDFTKVQSEAPYILAMLQDFNLLSDLEISLPALQNFISEAKMYYNHRRNPFHNFMHACSVMHNVYCVLTITAAGKMFEDWELLSLLIGALGHDMDHTGRTNAFESSKESLLALRYNDSSVLEQHHAAMLFQTLQKPGCNFLCAMEAAMKKQMRKFVIALILATDLSKHMAMIANMEARFGELEEEPLGSRPNDKKEAGELLMHCADLSNPTKTFEICFRWSSLLRKEFEAQVQEERDRSLPVTGYMVDLHRDSVFLKNEVSFFSVIVKPLWDCLGEWLSPGVDFALAQLNSNIETLKKMLDEAQDGA